jgi:CRP/FNR family transcriptional regulator
MAVGMCFRKGDVIFKQGDELAYVYVLTQGLVRLYHLTVDAQRQITGFLGPGDILGGIKRSAETYCTAETITDVEACGFDRKGFIEFVHDHPDLCLNLLVAATDEIEAQYVHSILLARKQATRRLAAFLLIMARRWQSPGEDARTVRIPMGRADIADHLGLTIETVSRVFGQFKRQGLTELRGPKTVILKNMPALYDLAGFEDFPERHMAMGL